MAKRVVIVQGHPDPAPERFCRALARAYMEGAAAGGVETRLIDVASLDFPLLRSADEWNRGEPPPAIRAAQEDIRWAEHLVLFYPLWLGAMPALLKAFLEQVLRPGFAVGLAGTRERKLLAGRSARIVVTMGMPALVYRWFFGAHSLRSLERNILSFCGIRPVRDTLVGAVESGGEARHRRWLDKLERLGAKGA